jgi:hypothetical protein
MGIGEKKAWLIDECKRLIREVNYGSSEHIVQEMMTAYGCHARVFTVGKGNRFMPWKMQRIGETSQTPNQHCFEYILDSGIGKDEFTNKEILDTAHDLNADYVIPKDYMADSIAKRKEARRKTTESIEQFWKIYRNHECRAKPIIPLQPPHDRHYTQLSGFRMYALGGMKDRPAKEQIENLKRFTHEAGWDKYVHGLGMGANIEFIKEVHKNPSIVDSIDLSTFEQRAIFAHAKEGKWGDGVGAMRGTKSSVIRGVLAKYLWLRYCHAISRWCDDEIIETPDHKSATDGW